SGVNYQGEKLINGIRLEGEYNFTLNTFTKVVESFFPNKQYPSDEPGWASIEPTNPPNPIDPPNPVDPPAPVDPPNPVDPPKPTPSPIDNTWVAKWLHSPAEAKALAHAHNRPILLILGDAICAHCDSLDKVINTVQMLSYAKSKKLVLLHSRINNVDLRLQIIADYRSLCKMGSSYPYLFLFKVKDDVTPAQLASNTLSPDEVSLLQISGGPYAGTLSGVNYQGEKLINGIRLEGEYNFTLNTFTKVVESFFPNKQYPSGEPGWASITPAVGPTGYDKAIDLGRIANSDYPADSGPGWIAYSASATFIGSESAHWYKFTGDAGKRYFCMARNFQEHNNPIAIALYASNTSGAPLDPPVFTANSTGFDALERGLYMDIPAGGGNNQLFYLRLSHSGGSADTALPYALKVHETYKSPAVGSVTNPLWRGAQKGKWTMDADKARELAAQEGAPLIYYFTGVLWCPYCVGMDHMVFSSAIFKDSIRNAYLVLLDNRQRDDRGPSLLLDNRPNGYLVSNKISVAAAATQLANNLKLQNALALPDASTAGWTHGSRIGYPTLLYCKVGAGAGLAGVTPIGRFSYQTFVDQPDANQAKTFIEELAMLAGKGHREANASPQTSPLLLPAPGDAVNAQAGGLAYGNWFKFSVSKEQTASAWLFNAQAPTAAAAAQVELAVYSADGLTLLRRAQGSLKDGSNLEFVPPSSDGGQYWLAIEPIEQPSAVTFTLNYRLEQLNYTVALEHTETAVAATDPGIILPLQLTTQLPNDSAVRFAYRIRCLENGAPASYFTTPNTWQQAEWSAEEKDAGRKQLLLPLTIPAGESWNGSRDVIIELQSIADGNCRIDNNGEECTVKIFSQPFFARPVAKAYGLFVGQPRNLSFRIRNYDVQSHTVSVTPGLPAGLAYQLRDAGTRSTEIDLHITGVPTCAVANHQANLEIRDNGGALLDQLPIIIDVINLTGTIADSDVYAGYLCPDNSGVGAPLGSLLINKSNAGLHLTLHSTSTVDALNAAVNWQSYDPAKEQYYLSYSWQANNANIALTLDSQGNGRGIFTAPSGEEQAVFFAPITQKPADFSGTYNVALRPKPSPTPHAYDGFALGWLRLTVDKTGAAAYSGELIDGTTFAGSTAVIEVADGSSRVIFFTPLNWDPVLSRYQGRLAGQLAITPLPLRYEAGAGFNDACVYDCSNALWARSATDQDAIQPCGTTYRARKTLTEQAGLTGQGLDFLFEVQQTAQNNQTVVPDLIFLTENSRGSALLPRTDNPLAAELQSLTVNTSTGVLSGKLNVLVAAQVSQPLLREAVILRGILTPLTSDCCSAGTDLALGYGYFTWRGTTYAFHITPHSALRNPSPQLKSIAGLAPVEPIPPVAGATVAVQIQSPSKRVLYQRQYSNELFLADWSDAAENHTDLALATGVTWQFVALSQDKAASASLLIAIPRQTTLSAALGNGAGLLVPGWNLIGIPANQHYTIMDKDGGSILAYDEDAGVYTSTNELNGGLAYWVFVPDNDFAATITQIEQPSANITGTPGWSFLALPASSLRDTVTAWYWNGKTFTRTPPNGVPAPGAWLYTPPTQP
ncbi:MAG: hypothetical protein GX945_16450, partial [Lentisphaerae bacterium]|nr:hypothetical protein [Lentisphaerota bacterium]